jgi:hypothetical protein
MIVCAPTISDRRAGRQTNSVEIADPHEEDRVGVSADKLCLTKEPDVIVANCGSLRVVQTVIFVRFGVRLRPAAFEPKRTPPWIQQVFLSRAHVRNASVLFAGVWLLLEGLDTIGLDSV